MTAEPISRDEEAAPTRGGTPHLKPVGPIPEAPALLVGALFYSASPLVVAVTENIDITVDLDPPAATVLTAVVALARNGLDPAPVLVADELRRNGMLDRRTATWVASATTAGATQESARRYAAVVVSESLRRQIESLGTALTSASTTASEAELNHLVAAGSARIKNITDRLSRLRGEDITQ